MSKFGKNRHHSAMPNHFERKSETASSQQSRHRTTPGAMSDIKYGIRKLEFTFWAREALLRIEQLIVGRNVPSAKQLDLANDLIKEFIFCECDRRGIRRTAGLNSLQELHLLDVLCKYFSELVSETSRNTIFLSLFGGPDVNRRMKVLCKLASMAISASVAPVLLALGVWLQQTGCSSPLSIQLAQSLVRDYFILHPTNDKPLKMLPKIAPQFVANFMTAVVEIYLKEGPNGTFSPPPKSLLEIITDWVYSNPRMCLSAQSNPSAFPSGGIPMTAISPLTGLIQWCALAPLYIFDQNENDVEMLDYPAVQSKQIKLEKPIESIIINTTTTELDLYGKLHLGVLQSLYEGRRPQGPSTTVNAQHLAQIITPIMHRITQLQRNESITSIDKKLEICLNRVAQATQIALAGGCVYGNIKNLLTTLDTLPENRLLRIIIKTHHQLN